MAFPNFHTDPRAYNRVKLGGVLIRAHLAEIDGIKVEAEWSEQKPTGSSGATWVFKGMKPAGPHKLTFKTGNGDGATAAERFDDIRALYERFGPQSVATGNAGTSAGGKGDAYASPSGKSNATSDGSASTIPSTPGASSTTDKDGFPKSTGVSPGPRPPTLTVENAFLAFVGTTAVSMKSFEIKPDATNSLVAIVELIPQKPPVQAGTGVAPAAKGDAFSGGASGAKADSAQAADKAAAQAGAGT